MDVFDKFMLSEQFRLELKWEKVIYNKEGVCEFKNAYFCGPAVKEITVLNSNDSITLDFYKQYVFLVKNIYLAKLCWGEVVFNSDNTISLKNVTMHHTTELNRVPKLSENDYMVIDVEDHQESKHVFNLVYKTYVVNEDTNLYVFRN
jgi:hypothetical protein